MTTKCWRRHILLPTILIILSIFSVSFAFYPLRQEYDWTRFYEKSYHTLLTEDSSQFVLNSTDLSDEIPYLEIDQLTVSEVRTNDTPIHLSLYDLSQEIILFNFPEIIKLDNDSITSRSNSWELTASRLYNDVDLSIEVIIEYEEIPPPVGLPPGYDIFIQLFRALPSIVLFTIGIFGLYRFHKRCDYSDDEYSTTSFTRTPLILLLLILGGAFVMPLLRGWGHGTFVQVDRLSEQDYPISIQVNDTNPIESIDVNDIIAVPVYGNELRLDSLSSDSEVMMRLIHDGNETVQIPRIVDLDESEMIIALANYTNTTIQFERVDTDTIVVFRIVETIQTWRWLDNPMEEIALAFLGCSLFFAAIVWGYYIGDVQESDES